MIKIIIIVVGVFLVFWIYNFVSDIIQSFYGVTFVVGEIGSGKTSYLAKKARDYIKSNRTVYSNIPIEGCYKLNIKDLIDKEPEPYSLLLIDESGLEFNSRDFKKTEHGMIEFFKLSRHYKCKVIFCSQTFTDSDKQIREVATQVLFLRKIINGQITMALRVIGKIGIDIQGQPCMQYEIKNLGGLIFLPLYRKYFDSFYRPERKKLPKELYEFNENLPKEP